MRPLSIASNTKNWHITPKPYPNIRHVDPDAWSPTGYAYARTPLQPSPPSIRLLSHLLAPLSAFLATLFTRGDRFSITRSSFLRSGGYGAAGAFFVVAVLVNHVRRVLVPWLGQFVVHTPLETMKFARSSPHYFLEQSLGQITWWGVAKWLAWRLVVRMAKETAQKRMLKAERDAHSYSPPSDDDQGSEKRERDARGLHAAPLALDVSRVAFLALCLADVEYRFVKASWAYSHIYTYYRLFLLGNAAERRFLKEIVFESRSRLVLQVLLVLVWLCGSFYPNAKSAVRATLRGQVSLPGFHWVVWSGTLHVVRYSNYYFVALEMSDLVVTGCWIVGGLGLLGFMKARDVWRHRGPSVKEKHKKEA